MSDLVDTLPAEFRTESLRSLPGDLKAIAVGQIKERFGLKPPAKKAVKKPKPIDDPCKIGQSEQAFVPVGPDAFFIDHIGYGVDRSVAINRFDLTAQVRRRRFTVEVYGRNFHKFVAVDVDESEWARMGPRLVEQLAVEEAERQYCRRFYPGEARTRIING